MLENSSTLLWNLLRYLNWYQAVNFNSKKFFNSSIYWAFYWAPCICRNQNCSRTTLGPMCTLKYLLFHSRAAVQQFSQLDCLHISPSKEIHFQSYWDQPLLKQLNRERLVQFQPFGAGQNILFIPGSSSWLLSRLLLTLQPRAIGD